MWRVTLRGRNSEPEQSEDSRTLDCDKILKTGDHGVFFYRGPQEKHAVLFRFLQRGLQKGEGAIYVASQEPSWRIRRSMEDFGLNVKALEKDGVLKVFDYDRWYIIDGEVNVSHMMMMSQRVFEEAMEIGLRGLRGCGETACFFEHQQQNALLKYELLIGRQLAFPLTSLCAYDVNHAKRLKGKYFASLIKAHGPVVTSRRAQEIPFDIFFMAIVHNVLATTFGELGEKMILGILAGRYALTPRKIADDPVAFIEGLERLIGSGSRVIKLSLIRQVHLKVGIRS